LFDRAPKLLGRLLGLAVFYGTAADSREEAWLGDSAIPYLSIGSVIPPVQGGWRFLVSGHDWSPYFFETVHGLFILLPTSGSYLIDLEGRSQGWLGPTRNNNTFEVSSDGSFFPIAYFTFISPEPQPLRTLSVGAIVGIVLAVLAVVALIVGLIAWRHYRRGSETTTSQARGPGSGRKHEDPGLEEAMLTGDFNSANTGNYETMADYADQTVEANEIFI
jgi:hypothetical protein